MRVGPRPSASRPAAARMAPETLPGIARPQVREHVRHHLLEHDVKRTGPGNARHVDIATFAHTQHLGANVACGRRPGKQGQEQGHTFDADSAHIGGAPARPFPASARRAPGSRSASGQCGSRENSLPEGNAEDRRESACSMSRHGGLPRGVVVHEEDGGAIGHLRTPLARGQGETKRGTPVGIGGSPNMPPCAATIDRQIANPSSHSFGFCGVKRLKNPPRSWRLIPFP